MAKYYIKTKLKECLPMDEWITKLEMRAFGWVYKGIETTYYNSYKVSINWDTGKGTASRERRFDNQFKRIEPYSYSIIFRFLEGLMGIFSWIRRKLLFLFFGMIVILAGIGIITQDMKSVGMALTVLALIYLPSLYCAVAGFLVRKLFGLDRKLRHRLAKNGYDEDQRL